MSREQQRAAAAVEVDQWEARLATELEALFDRQRATTLARLTGKKGRKNTRHWLPPVGESPVVERKIDPRYVIDAGRWVAEAVGSLRPLVRRMYAAAYGRVAKQFGAPQDPEEQAAEEVVSQRLDLIGQGIETAAGEVQAFIAAEDDAGSSMKQIADGVSDLYAQRTSTWVQRICVLSAVGTINQAAMNAAYHAGSASKSWLSRRDDKVRDTHEHADGQTRPILGKFKLGGIPTHPAKSELMFPGDPTGPIDETVNCRCTLLFAAARAGARKDGPPLEAKDKVRSAAGVRQYGQPIGATIVPDLPSVGGQMPLFSGAAASAPPARTPAKPRVVGKLKDGGVVSLSGGDAEVRRMIADHARQGTGVPPDPATTEVLAMRDRKGRIGAYLVWQTEDGPQPKGTILEVSVHPKLRGQRIGDQLVQMAAKLDPDVQATTRPATPPRGPVPQPGGSSRGLAAGLPPPTRQGAPRPPRGPQLGPDGLPDVRDRTRPGDQPGTSGDYDADVARIDRLQKAYMRDRMDTTSVYQSRGRWSREREKQQQEIIDHFLNQPGVKSNHKILVLGGVPGAGKTTVINSPEGQAALGIDLTEYVTVNADEVKEEMIRRGMIPDYPGLSAQESATMYHAESFEVAHSLMRQAAKRKLNFAYDTTLKTEGQLGFATNAGSRTMPPPWETTMLFVDVPVSVAKQRAKQRYLDGGRYLPLGYIDNLKAHSKRHQSRPAENFDRVKGSVNRWVMVDNTGKDPVVVDQGGKRKKGPGPAPAAPTAARSAAVSGGTTTPAAALPPVPAGARVYTHPQGKTIYLLPDGSMQVYKPDGKKATSSATPQKLLAGYGGWAEVVGGQAPAFGPTSPSSGTKPTLVASPAAPPKEQPSTPAPAGSMPVVPMDFNEAPLSDVPKYIADDDYVFQQKVDGIRGVLVVEPGKTPWFASKKGERLQSSTAAKITGPMLAKLPATPAGAPSYRVEGELLNGKFHVFDMTIVGQEATPYEKRKQMADAWVDAVAGGLPQVEALPTARTPAEKQALWEAVQKSGAEGVMMKRRDAGYNGGARVNHTLKAKITATADVVVVEKGIGGKDNARIALLHGGKVTPIGTISTLGKGPIDVGDVVEVEYLWATPANTLTQPRILRKRPDKNVNDVTDSGQLRQVDKTVLAMAAKSLRLRLEYAMEAV